MNLRERVKAYLDGVPENERASARIRLHAAFAFLAEATAGHEPLDLDARHEISLREVLIATGILCAEPCGTCDGAGCPVCRPEPCTHPEIEDGRCAFCCEPIGESRSKP